MSQDNQDTVERLTRIERKLDEHREEEKSNGKKIDGLTREVSGLSANVGKMVSELVRR